MRAVMTDFLDRLRSTQHRITAEWHQDDVWIAEVEASYELRDWLALNRLPRMFLLRVGPEGEDAHALVGAGLGGVGQRENVVDDDGAADEGVDSAVIGVGAWLRERCAEGAVGRQGSRVPRPCHHWWLCGRLGQHWSR